MAETLSRYLLQFASKMAPSQAAIANLSTRWMELVIAPVCVSQEMRRLLFTIGVGRALKTGNWGDIWVRVRKYCLFKALHYVAFNTKCSNKTLSLKKDPFNLEICLFPGCHQLFQKNAFLEPSFFVLSRNKNALTENFESVHKPGYLKECLFSGAFSVFWGMNSYFRKQFCILRNGELIFGKNVRHSARQQKDIRILSSRNRLLGLI